MGFWKRLTEFLLVGGGFNDQFKFISDHSQVDRVDSVVDDFYPASSVDAECRTAKNRRCWTSDLDIHTDYEEVIPTGEVKKVCASSSLYTRYSHADEKSTVISRGWQPSDCS